MAITKISRKFNLARIGKNYETTEITAEGKNVAKLVEEIDVAWAYYSEKIVNGEVM